MSGLMEAFLESGRFQVLPREVLDSMGAIAIVEYTSYVERERLNDAIDAIPNRIESGALPSTISPSAIFAIGLGSSRTTGSLIFKIRQRLPASGISA
jgi:hypothetical protein